MTSEDTKKTIDFEFTTDNHYSSGDYDDQNKLLFRPEFVFAKGLRPVSLKISYTGRDQGWGNAKGRVWVRLVGPVDKELKEMLQLDEDWAPKSGDQDTYAPIIAEDTPFETIAHSDREDSITLTPESSKVLSRARPGQTIEFWKYTGGGGGHELHLRDFKATLSCIRDDSFSAEKSSEADTKDSSKKTRPLPKLVIKKAFYGVDSNGSDVTRICALRALRNNNVLHIPTSVSFNSLFSDPVPNVVKKFTVTYQIGLNGAEQTVIFDEHARGDVKIGIALPEATPSSAVTLSGASSLITELAALRADKKTSAAFSDIKFIVGEKKVEIPAHKIVLAARSATWAKDLADSKVNTITLASYDADVFQSFVDFFYGADLSVDIKSAPIALSLGRDYDIPALREAAGRALAQGVLYNNIFECMAFAIKEKMPSYFSACLDYLCTNFDLCMYGADFENLTKEVLQKIVQSEDFWLSEESRLQVAETWAERCLEAEGKESTAKSRAPYIAQIANDLHLIDMPYLVLINKITQYGVFDNASLIAAISAQFGSSDDSSTSTPTSTSTAPAAAAEQKAYMTPRRLNGKTWGVRVQKSNELGLKGIEDSQFSVSGSWDSNHGPERCRLNFTATSGGSSAWCASSNDLSNWLIIDFLQPKIIKAFALQGRADYDQWVTKYTLEAGNDKENLSAIGEFTGPNGRNDIVVANFAPVKARYLRFKALTWVGHISVRLDVFAESL